MTGRLAQLQSRRGRQPLPASAQAGAPPADLLQPELRHLGAVGAAGGAHRALAELQPPAALQAHASGTPVLPSTVTPLIPPLEQRSTGKPPKRRQYHASITSLSPGARVSAPEWDLHPARSVLPHWCAPSGMPAVCLSCLAKPCACLCLLAWYRARELCMPWTPWLVSGDRPLSHVAVDLCHKLNVCSSSWVWRR